MRMLPKRPIGGSGDARAATTPEHGVEMETEVAITAGELSLHPDVDDHSGDDSDDHSGDDSDDHSGDDSDDDRQLVSHLYLFMCQIDPRFSLVTPASPFLE